MKSDTGCKIANVLRTTGRQELCSNSGKLDYSGRLKAEQRRLRQLKFGARRRGTKLSPDGCFPCASCNLLLVHHLRLSSSDCRYDQGEDSDEEDSIPMSVQQQLDAGTVQMPYHSKRWDKGGGSAW